MLSSTNNKLFHKLKKGFWRHFEETKNDNTQVDIGLIGVTIHIISTGTYRSIQVPSGHRSNSI